MFWLLFLGKQRLDASFAEHIVWTGKNAVFSYLTAQGLGYNQGEDLPFPLFN